MPAKDHSFSVQDARDLYNIDAWGAGYFGVSDAGELEVQVPGQDPVSLHAIVAKLQDRDVALPAVLRFPQILEDRLALLNQAFANSIEEAGYGNHYQGVYPIKVNQNKLVVETLAESGARHRTGLEAGSKAELALILIQDTHDEALLCCNGFKDDDFVRMALWGRKLGRNVLVTLEKYGELERVLRVAAELEVEPAMGIRYKLHSKGSGRWETSGGDDAKFGLTTAELVHAAQKLVAEGRGDCLQMLHCHLGSQITDIRRIKVAAGEAAQAYVELRRMGVGVKYLNLGGGLAVDYDGSKTTFHASANYGLQEYADSVVWSVKETCDEAGVEHPILVTESGRALTAHHGIFVVPIVDTISPTSVDLELPPAEGQNKALVQEMIELRDAVTAKNYREIYHDAVDNKDTMHKLFELGYLSLNERAHIERHFYGILKRISQVIQSLDYVPEEFEALPKMLAHKYVGNFSIFQAIPDAWAIDALFPIVPLHRLDERPSCEATLVDISCDSDGKIENFIDLRDVRKTLPLHPVEKGTPYYLGILLTGAYQDVLANNHNLFGRVNQAHVVLEKGGFKIREVVPGQKARVMIEDMGYKVGELHKWLLETIAEADVVLPKGQKRKFVELYDSELVGYTYLEDV